MILFRPSIKVKELTLNGETVMMTHHDWAEGHSQIRKADECRTAKLPGSCHLKDPKSAIFRFILFKVKFKIKNIFKFISEPLC